MGRLKNLHKLPLINHTAFAGALPAITRHHIFFSETISIGAKNEGFGAIIVAPCVVADRRATGVSV
jgi:hypothetical protein